MRRPRRSVYVFSGVALRAADPAEEATARARPPLGLSDEQTQQMPCGAVEGADDDLDAGGEVMHAAAKLVLTGERAPS